jgi:hypothetical protein
VLDSWLCFQLLATFVVGSELVLNPAVALDLLQWRRDCERVLCCMHSSADGAAYWGSQQMLKQPALSMLCFP